MIRGFFLFFSVEILHYLYLFYRINSTRSIKDGNIEYKNFLEDQIILRYLKRSDHENKMEIENIYNYLSNTFKLNYNNQLIFVTPNLLSIRLINSIIFICQLVYLKYLGFKIEFTTNSIIFEKKTNTDKLVLFHTGMLGNLHHMIKFMLTLNHKKYSVMIVIFRSNLNTFFWNYSNLDQHVIHLDKKIDCYSNIIPISHSFGSFILESLYNYNNSVTNKINKEILIQPGNVASMGIIFIGSQHLNYWSYINFISKYSKYYIHNMIFAYIIKSLAGLSSIYSVKNFKGIRLESKKISGYIILSANDPLININKNHPFSDEIQHIFPHHIILNNYGYHGISEENEFAVEKCLKEIIIE